MNTFLAWVAAVPELEVSSNETPTHASLFNHKYYSQSHLSIKGVNNDVQLVA